MSAILYYSKHCKNCDKIISELSQSRAQNDIHFVCVDKRARLENGQTCVVLDTGEQVALPEQITRVPALLLLQEDNRILFGNDIYDVVSLTVQREKHAATKGYGEPREAGGSDLMSSVSAGSGLYSALDENDAFAEQHGCYASASYDNIDRIETPPDDYQPDKMNEDSIKTYQEERNTAVPQNAKTHGYGEAMAAVL